MRSACFGRFARSHRFRRALAALAVGWVASCGFPGAREAQAAGPGAPDLQAARELFAQAEKDEDAGRWTDALEALRRVAEVKLTAGVRYHIALCEEQLGQLAKALADYAVAETQARGENAQDVLRLVGKQATGLSARVPRLTVHVSPQVPSAEVRVDGEPIAPAMIGVAMPVDPGMHTLQATAPDHPASTATVRLEEHDATVIEMRLGEPVGSRVSASASASAPVPAPARESASSTTRTGALVATFGGVILAGGGIAAFVLAGDAVSTGQAQCALGAAPCDADKRTVRAWDWIAAGAWAGAAVAGAVAVVLWTRPAHGASPPATAGLLVGPASVALGGSF